MYKKLFQITIVLFLIVVTIVVLGLLISVLSASSPGIRAGAGGSSSFVLYSVSQRQLGYIIVAASLIVAAFYLFFRRSRFRR
jgi:hypothetical protein